MNRLSAAAMALLVCACSKGQSGPGGPPAPQPERICTAIGCNDGLEIEVAKAGAWQPGAYTFAFALDGEKVTCTGALPLKPCDAGQSLACDAPGKVEIGESGCALPAGDHGFAGIRVPGRPARVELTIARDGQQIGAGVFTPNYVESRPNGPGCEPVCTSGTARIELP